MHPGAWLLWGISGGAAALSTTNPFYLVVLWMAAWFVHSVHHDRGAPGARSFHVLASFGAAAIVTRTALVLFGDVTAAHVTAAFYEGLRLAVLLGIFGAFNSVADPADLIRLAPRRWHEPALAAALVLSLAPRTIAAAAQVRSAQRLRGLEIRGVRSFVALAVPVLANGMDQALTLAESMDARGHGRGGRSRYRATRWDRRALIVAAAGVACAAAFVASPNGLLTPSTWPPEWPEADVRLVAAAAVLGLPGLLRRAP